MSIKSIIQILILLVIIMILGSVYFQYFSKEKTIIEETAKTNLESEKLYQGLEKKIIELEKKNDKLKEEIEIKIDQLDKKKEDEKLEAKKRLLEEEKKLEEEKRLLEEEKKLLKNLKKLEDEKKLKTENKKKKVKNVVKDVEYISRDKKGNKFRLLAISAKSNEDDNNLLDLKNVRGVITSDIRDPIYIVSDFAQYNTSNSNSKFYQNVIINYMDKEITCENFDIDMETNMAIAYNDVIVTDPKSTMKAGIITFDLKTKNININPESENTKVKVTTN